MKLNKERNGYTLLNEKIKLTIIIIVLLHLNVNNQNNLCFLVVLTKIIVK